MTHLRELMLQELQRRNYSQTTVTGYIKTVADFAKYFQKPPDQLGSDEIRHINCTCSRSGSRGCERLATTRPRCVSFSARP
ncbi:MAG: phage integrase N-terminal SAM-like domain-containing protein [Acidobacteriaceae bacterium]|nr:phage integrase N-terminal SAM-like domain-containing protein [Acidobacteriaceae bacterium]